MTPRHPVVRFGAIFSVAYIAVTLILGVWYLTDSGGPAVTDAALANEGNLTPGDAWDLAVVALAPPAIIWALLFTGYSAVRAFGHARRTGKNQIAVEHGFDDPRPGFTARPQNQPKS